jgi:hypothetical protein
MKYTPEEIASAEGHYHASDHDTESETWDYVADMMYCAGFPSRSTNAYRQKLHKVWNSKNNQ